MEYENIDPIAEELTKMIAPVKKLLESNAENIKQVKNELLGSRKLQSFEKFTRDIIHHGNDIPPENKVDYYASTIAKLADLMRDEQRSQAENLVRFQERHVVLTTVIEHFDKQIQALSARKTAIERVASSDGEEKRPERLAVVREAEKLKKSKQQNT